jgi:hypothetical protein
VDVGYLFRTMTGKILVLTTQIRTFLDIEPFGAEIFESSVEFFRRRGRGR